jgi:integrase
VPGRRQHGEDSLFQRSRDGRWVARAHLGYRDGRPDRREFVRATPREALEARQRFLDQRRDGFTPPKGRPPTVSEWMLHWLHNIARRKVRASTWHKSYRQKVTDHICPWFDHVPLPDLDEDLIEEFHAHLEDQGLAPATITQIHRIMSRALKVAVVRKRIGRNPCSNVTPPQIKGSARPEPLTAEEIGVLLDGCESWPRGVRWLLALSTGMRQGEVLGLTWEHLDLDAGTVHVVQELVRLPWQHGCGDPRICGTHIRICPRPCPKVRPSGRRHVCITKGDPRLCRPDCEKHASTCPARRDGGLVLTEPKSETSVRWISIGAELAGKLKRHRQEQLAARLAAGPAWKGWEHGDIVFAGPSGRPVDPRRDWQDWKDLLGEIGILARRPHDVRHQTATDLLEEGIDVKVVQEILGHATPDFTRRVYQHGTKRLHQAAADKLDARLKRKA